MDHKKLFKILSTEYLTKLTQLSGEEIERVIRFPETTLDAIIEINRRFKIAIWSFGVIIILMAVLFVGLLILLQ
jgi:hypothetical protein